MREYTWREKLKGKAFNTWLYPRERDEILSGVEGLTEEEAKKMYFEVQARIDGRLGYWQQSL